MPRTQRIWTLSLVIAAAFAGGFCGTLLLQSGVALAQQDNGPKVLTASSINIVDADGKTRMTVGINDRKVGMVVMSPAGTPRVALGTDGEEAGLIMTFTDGKNAFHAGVKDQGSGMNIWNTQGKERITMGADPASAGLSLYYTDGSEAYSAGATDKDAGFGVNYAGTKKVCFSFGTGPKGTGFSMKMPDDKEVFGVGMPPNLGPSLFINDTAGKQVFRVP